MKKILILSFLMLFSLFTKAQDISEEIMIGFGCGFSGSSSEPVKKMQNLLEKLNYKRIRKSITAQNLAEKTLSIMICQRLEKDGIIQLTDMEKSKIKETYLATAYIFECSGCAYFHTVKLVDFLNTKTPVSNLVDNWLNRFLVKK